MAGDKDRILVIAITCDESDDTVICTSIKYYRDRQHYADSDYLTMKMTAGAAAATHQIALGELLPPPSHIFIASTFQA